MALAVTLGSAVAAPAPAQATSAATTSPAPIETIHTTSNHPWLTADRGWVEAGQLRPGEPVVTLSGATETVAWVHVVAGQADMYNLTVAKDHTNAVGAGQVVVHNVGCGNADLDRIDQLRSDYHVPSRGNFGFMEYSVEGDGVEAESGFKAAISGHNPNLAGDLAPEVDPAARMFTPTVQGGYLRDGDAEYKLAEWFGSRFGDTPGITGNVTIVSEYPICDSCITLDDQIRARFPSLNVELRWAGRPWGSLLIP